MIDDAAFNEIILTRLKFAAQQILPRYIAEHLDVNLISSEMDRLVYQLRSEVLVERYDTQKAHGSLTLKFDVPASWWQHFKQQYRRTWWCRWLVRRRPVQVTTYSKTGHATFDIERYRAFPDAEYQFPKKLGREVRMLTNGPMWWGTP